MNTQSIHFTADDTFYAESIRFYHIPLSRKKLIPFGRICIISAKTYIIHWLHKMEVLTYGIAKEELAIVL